MKLWLQIRKSEMCSEHLNAEQSQVPRKMVKTVEKWKQEVLETDASQAFVDSFSKNAGKCMNETPD